MSIKPSEPAERRFSSLQTILLFVAVAGIVFAVSRFALMRSPRNAGAAHRAVGNVAPDVTFSPLTADQPIRLSTEKGKVVLINFWATWCGPCKSEFPHLIKVTEPYLSRNDFVMVSVNADGREGNQEPLAREAQAFLAKYEAKFPALIDPSGDAYATILATAQETNGGIPMTLIVDRGGKIAGFWMGYESGDEDEVAQVLSVALQNVPQP